MATKDSITTKHIMQLFKRLDAAKADAIVWLTKFVDERVEERVGNCMTLLDAALRAKPVHSAPTAKAKAPDPKRRKGPIQLCPVPKCKERAAPVYGMVCKKHRAVPKKLIAKYRSARSAKKAKWATI